MFLDVCTVSATEIFVPWNMTSSSPMILNRCFGRKYRPYFYDRRVSRASKERDSRYIFDWSVFNPEETARIFLGNIS
jgi:hypothetical protein